ncbi:MAG TPA: PilZ domain-containing protein [Terriglobales bacterium]|nr:PilZ domain-containing protein [Terriglobales bacterium]
MAGDRAAKPKRYEEMRRYPRVKSDLRVRVFVPPKNPTADSFGRGYDLSESGMAIYVPLELAVGQQVLVVLEVPQYRVRLGLTATVRNADGYRYGVEFGALSNTERKELKRALESLAAITNPAA